MSLIDFPEISEFDPKYETFLNSVSYCEGRLWVCGDNRMVKSFNLNNLEEKKYKTISRYGPSDIAVKRNGHLVYTDISTKSINIVDTTQQRDRETINLNNWEPINVCSTSSDNLLVVMVNDDAENKKTKVVRYSGVEEIQSYQFEDTDKPLYSSSGTKFISENGNEDICVADCKGGKVVVINKDGDFQFAYAGLLPSQQGSFQPVGIATDSKHRILTVDQTDKKIFIIDANGQFLKCYQNCSLNDPLGICVDAENKLYVAENSTRKVKQIKYSQ